MSKSLFEDVYDISLRKLKQLPQEDIRKNKIDEAIKLTLDFLEIPTSVFNDFDKCSELLLSNLKISTDEPSILTDDTDHIDWYDNSSSRPYWDTHKQWLQGNLKLPYSVINSLDKTTDEIVSKLENPARPGSWDRRGLVVGSVQSGKTSHFIALINKAVDAGYKRIIVLSGLTNDLRRQTHQRLDEGFFGFNTELIGGLNNHTDVDGDNNYLSLGKIRGSNFPRPITLTNSGMKGDLSTNVVNQANILSDHPILFCIKKNKTSLQNTLKFFLSAPEVSNNVAFSNNPFELISDAEAPYLNKSPILIIDDEVDNASVDTGNQYFDENDNPNEEYDPKTINRLIRQLLHIHAKKAFIGYTATPFSNIYIHEDGFTKKHGPDLFPKSFIYDLPVPSNYFGIEKLYQDKNEYLYENKFIKYINDHCNDIEDLNCSDGWIPPKHEKDHNPILETGLNPPNSLIESIYVFLISVCLRNSRGQLNQHKTMLIHVSKYVLVNQNIFKQVSNVLDQTRSTLINPGDLNYKNLINQLDRIFKNLKNNDLDKIDTLNDLLNMDNGLFEVIQDVSKNIKCLIGSSDDYLDYDNYKSKNNKGLVTIVIGGDRLSRGITLEGLTTSYFLRSSKMYDTLMQMGRWFGYRDGYEDLTNLYTTDDLSEWFEYISNAISELRVQFRTMSHYGISPVNFGLKIKSHPLLMITSRVKMRNGQEIKTSFVDHFSQTVSFDLSKIESNLLLTNDLFNEIGQPIPINDINKEAHKLFNSKKSYLWKNIDSKIIVNYLKKFLIHEDAKSVQPFFYSEFIDKMNLYGELVNWSIALIGSGKSKYNYIFNDKYKVELSLRKPKKFSKENKLSIGVLADPKHEGVDLSETQLKKAIELSVDQNFGFNFRKQRPKENGLLLLYPIITIDNNDSYEKIKNNVAYVNYKETPTLGFAISFPSNSAVSREDSNIRYVVNNIYQKDLVD